MNLTKEEIQEIIDNEIVVDAYGEFEVRAGWTAYMDDELTFPFEADYDIKKTNGENITARVKVVSAEIDEESINNIYVEVEYQDMLIPVPLEALKNIEADEETLTAIQVWGYRGDYL